MFTLPTLSPSPSPQGEVHHLLQLVLVGVSRIGEPLQVDDEYWWESPDGDLFGGFSVFLTHTTIPETPNPSVQSATLETTPPTPLFGYHTPHMTSGLETLNNTPFIFHPHRAHTYTSLETTPHQAHPLLTIPSYSPYLLKGHTHSRSPRLLFRDYTPSHLNSSCPFPLTTSLETTPLPTHHASSLERVSG